MQTHQDAIAAHTWGNAMGEQGHSFTANRAAIVFLILSESETTYKGSKTLCKDGKTGRGQSSEIAELLQVNDNSEKGRREIKDSKKKKKKGTDPPKHRSAKKSSRPAAPGAV